MVPLNFNLTLCMHHIHMLSIDFCALLVNCSYVILHLIKMTLHFMRIMHENNASKFSKCEPCQKNLKILLYTNLT